ncbi:MAG TPA: DNA recombination protein RmuC [Victivallales bacterium]|nr:DNA recombination protein RmuC [Victivallales bacterium]HPO89745.1 DNA recombination protein RmuC [Victivallales bacterium]HRR05699.1 DNA recombination protein RmuC [Victivallales bacterium]HRR28103.1 DNA recombination protein RmuC [Victivallales bacterium]
MTIEHNIIILVIANFAALILLLLILARLKKNEKYYIIEDERNKQFISIIERLERTIKDESLRNRDELNSNFKSFREELNNLFKNFSETIIQNSNTMSNMQKGQFETFSRELSNNIKIFEEALSKNIGDFTISQKQKMDDFENRLLKTKSDIDTLLEKVCQTMEKNLREINEENSKKLEEMRKTVDEKLHENLEKRLSQSFMQVSDRLKQVYEGLGEMKNLATGVGDLKKVLSNVKTRGIMGEIQLEAILQNILSPSQYEKNISLKNSKEAVEFALKMPGNNTDEPVYIPIDSKFPAERYENLIKSYENGDKAKIEQELSNLEKEIKRCAKEISEKYINPPTTTDFAIMFLPFEGLYAEVVRNSRLVEDIQKQFRVSVTGPSTLAAFLNCIQMGFRSFAIRQRTTEVWKILSAVKTEFKKFADTLDEARKKIQAADDKIGELVGKRTKKIQLKLREVEALPENENPAELLGLQEQDEEQKENLLT